MEFPVTLTSLIFVVLLIVPGVVLKRFYFQGEFTKEFTFGIFADRLISSIFLGIVVQIVSFLALGKIFGFTYESIKHPITKLYKGLSESDFKIVTSGDLWMALGYMATSLFVAVILGWSTHLIVTLFRWDAKFPLFRFNNQWNYFFRGDIVHSRKFKSINKGKVIQTYIDVVLDVEENGKKKMISGFLSDYSISSRTGDLETIYVTDTKRFSNTHQSHVSVEGDCFIIPYSKVIDMNLKYVFKERGVSRMRQAITFIFEKITVVGIFGVLFYPWFLDTRFIVKFLIFFISLIAYSLFMAIIGSFLTESSDKKLEGDSLYASIVTMFVFLALLLLIMYMSNIISLSFWPFKSTIR